MLSLRWLERAGGRRTQTAQASPRFFFWTDNQDVMSGIDNDPDGGNGPEPSTVFYVVVIDRLLLVVVARAAVGQDVSRGVGTNASFVRPSMACMGSRMQQDSQPPPPAQRGKNQEACFRCW